MKIAFDWDEWTNEIYTGQDYKKQSNKNKIFFFFKILNEEKTKSQYEKTQSVV